MTSVKATLLMTDGRPDVIRRFLADPDVILCYSGLLAKLNHVFPGLTPDNFAIYWRDCDGDLITISSDEEASFAMTAQQRNHTINFVIKDSGSPGLLHPGVICDGCNGAIYGRRFKCAVCADYDLCAACDEKGIHSGHLMVRIATPREKCSANQGPRFCRMGGRPRFCPLFSEVPQSAFGGPTSFSGPYVVTSGQPCFQNFDQMAKTIIENCSLAMQPQPKPQASGEDKKPEGEDTKGEANCQRSDEGFDVHAFSAMMEEVSENFRDVLSSLGGKSKAGDEEKQTQEGPKEKQGRQAEGADQANPGAFDFEKLAEAMGPIIGNFMGVLGGEGQKASTSARKDVGNGQTAGHGHAEGKPRNNGAEGINNGKENQKTDNRHQDQPNFEQTFQPWMNVLQNFLSGSQTAHTGVPDTEGASQQGAASSPSGEANFNPTQMSQNVQEVMSGLLQQFGISPNVPSTSQPSGATCGQSQRCPTRDGHTDRSDSSPTKDGHATKPASPQKPFNFVNVETQGLSSSSAPNPDNSSCDESRLARSLAQLKSMGFSDDGEWLTSLLREKQGDVGRVLDVILPPRM